MVQGGVARDVERPRGLAHAGPGRHDDEVLGLEAGRDVVQLLETGGNPGDRLAFARAGVDVLQHLAHDLADGAGVLAAVLLRHLEHHALGFVEELLVVAEFSVGARLDLGARGDEPPQGGLFLHQAGVVPDVLGGGNGIGQLDEIGLAILQACERTAVFELVAEGNHVDGLAPLVEFEHGHENFPVRGQQEIVGRDGGRHLVEGRGLD